MVEVGDKVFVTPVNGQKDYIAVITGPGGAGAVLNEGNYNTWTLEWCKTIKDPVIATDIPGGVYNRDHIDYFIDDRNDVIQMVWETTSRNERYGIFSCVDFTNLMVTPGTDGIDDPYCWNYANYVYGYRFGSVGGCQGFSRSVQTYVLFLTYGTPPYGTNYLDVYRNTSRLWHHNVWDDLPAPQNTDAEVDSMAISTTGKYILCVTDKYSGGYYTNILFYKGSYVE